MSLNTEWSALCTARAAWLHKSIYLLGSRDLPWCVAVLLAVVAVLGATPASAGLLVHEANAELTITSPANGTVFLVPESNPFVSVTALANSSITYTVSTAPGQSETLRHFYTITLGSKTLEDSLDQVVPANASYLELGVDIDYVITNLLGVGEHILWAQHKAVDIATSVIHASASDIYTLYVVAVPAPVPPTGALFGLGAAALLLMTGWNRRHRVA